MHMFTNRCFSNSFDSIGSTEISLLLFLLSLLPLPLKIGVTLTTFHFAGNVCVSIQWLVSLLRDPAIAAAAIRSNLTLIP